MPKHTNVIDTALLLCRSVQVSYYDWWSTVVRWLFMLFSQDFLVLPAKKSDMHVKFKRQLNCTHHRHEPQSSLAQLCIEMLIQVTKDTNFRRFCFNRHPRYTSTIYKKHTLFLYFSDFSIFFFFFFFKKNKTKQKLKNNRTKTC